MELEEVREYCLSKEDVTETLPFGVDTLVFKVTNKMFCLVSITEASFINLKCNPEKAIELRELYPDEIKPGYHMSKVHWNSVTINGKLSEQFIENLIDHSYDLVKVLPKKVK